MTSERIAMNLESTLTVAELIAKLQAMQAVYGENVPVVTSGDSMISKVARRGGHRLGCASEKTAIVLHTFKENKNFYDPDDED